MVSWSATDSPQRLMGVVPHMTRKRCRLGLVSRSCRLQCRCWVRHLSFSFALLFLVWRSRSFINTACRDERNAAKAPLPLFGRLQHVVQPSQVATTSTSTCMTWCNAKRYVFSGLVLASGVCALRAVGGGSYSPSSSILSLTKNMIGVGVLFIPQVALISNGLPPVAVILLLMACVSAFSMLLLARCCERLQIFSYRDLWIETYGETYVWVVDACLFINAAVACVSYCLLIERFFNKTIQGLLPGTLIADLPSEVILGAVALFIIFPLCLARDLSALRITSFLGLAVTALVAKFVATDFVANFDDPMAARGGLSSADILAQPGAPVGPYLCQVSSILTSGFSAHYNVPKLYGEVPGENRSLSSFTTVICCSIGFALVTNAVFIVCGYGRFGESLDSTLLASYPYSFDSVICWTLMAINMMFTYPLVFPVARDTLMSVTSQLQRPSDVSRAVVTFGLVVFTAVLGHMVDSLSFVNGLKGALATMGLMYIFPGLLHLKVFANDPDGHGWNAACQMTIVFGVVNAVVGLAVMLFHC